MNVCLTQYAGIDAVSGLPLAAGLLVATARMDAILGRTIAFDILVEREPLAEAVTAMHEPDVLGLSLYPWNAAYSLAVASAARRALPDAFLVAGGPAIPRRPDSARAFMDANPALDALVLGEGELAFPALLRTLLDGGDLQAVPGLVHRAADGEIRFTTPPERVRDFAATGSPYLDGTFDRLLARHPGRFAMAVCETNRGCPFSCTFCDWSMTRQVVEYPIERVRAEIEWVADKGLSNLCFTDANFGIRRRDKHIAQHLAEQKMRTGTPRFCYFYLTKNNHRRNVQTIDIFTAAGIDYCVGLAVQDFDDEVLLAVKRDNIQSDESMRLREICATRGIRTHNELILGLPRQTYDSFVATVLHAMPGHPRHDFRIFLCRLIDNTELADAGTRAQYGIESRTCLWRPADRAFDPIVDEYQELVVATRDMPAGQWRRTCRFAYLAAAAYNQRLLREALRYLGEQGIDRKAWLETLCAAMEEGSGWTRYEAIGRAVDRLLDSLLANGPLGLAIDGHGEYLHELAETITVTALMDVEGFYAETQALSRVALAGRVSSRVMDDLLRFQEFGIPRFGRPETLERTFEHDWLGYATGQAGTPVEAVPTTLRYQPPDFVRVPQRGTYAALYLACSLTGTGLGELRHTQTTAPRPPDSAPGSMRQTGVGIASAACDRPGWLSARRIS